MVEVGLGTAEAPAVNGDRAEHGERNEQAVIDALNARAQMIAVMLQHGGGLLHPHVEVERHSERVGRA